MGLKLLKHALWIAAVSMCVSLGAQAALAQATPPPRATPTSINEPPPRSTPTPVGSTATPVETPSRPTPTSSGELPPPRPTPTTSQAARPQPKDKAPESTPVAMPATPAVLPVSGAATPDPTYVPALWWALAGLAMVCLGLGFLLYRRRHRPE